MCGMNRLVEPIHPLYVTLKGIQIEQNVDKRFFLIQFKIVQYFVFREIHFVAVVEPFEMKATVSKEVCDAFDRGGAKAF
jgi:hypothetical protein